MRRCPVDAPATRAAREVGLRGADVGRNSRPRLAGGQVLQGLVAERAARQQRAERVDLERAQNLAELEAEGVVRDEQMLWQGAPAQEPGIAGQQDAALVLGAAGERRTVECRIVERVE